jgi:DNA ligase-associated metallophosphoesterase
VTQARQQAKPFDFPFRESECAPSAHAAVREGTALAINGAELVADCAGVLLWPQQHALIVADLHLEKGSAFATRGMLLPPYDTAETLARLAALIARHDPRLVIALGDNFHDGGGPARLAPHDRDALTALQRGRDWVWIAGNHDPEPAQGIGGTFANVLALGPLAFRHEPTEAPADGEIAGHLHPSARISRRGRAVVRRCFVSDGKRMVMPAFGAYAGGLNIRDRAFAKVFATLDFTAHLLGARRIYTFTAARCQ